MIKIANAPCSWGVLEFDLEGETAGYLQVLDEITATGYAGTELGDWGFMPTDPMTLRKDLSDHHLELVGAFISVALAHPESFTEGEDNALKVSNLMYNAGYNNAFIVLADDNEKVEERTKNAGRITPALGLSDKQWSVFATGAEKMAEKVLEEYGYKTVFHHHCGGYIETPDEIEKLMDYTDPELIGLCLDTGHYRFGGGDPTKALEKYADRIWHIHFKDYNAGTGEASVKKKWNYFESVKQGVFCELGKGDVDFKAITDALRDRNYNGWIVVEQDVLPGMGNPRHYAKSNRIYLKTLGL